MNIQFGRQQQVSPVLSPCRLQESRLSHQEFWRPSRECSHAELALFCPTATQHRKRRQLPPLHQQPRFQAQLKTLPEHRRGCVARKPSHSLLERLLRQCGCLLLLHSTETPFNKVIQLFSRWRLPIVPF